MPLINFAGLASGIDSEALIDAVREARRQQRVIPNEERISELEAETEAINELDTLLVELQDILLGFSDVEGGAVSKSVSSSDETTVTAVASNAADPGSYSLTVSQLAENATFSFTERTTNPDGAIITTGGQSGAMEVTIGTGSEEETFTLNVDDTTTWNELASQFNESTDRATANVVNVGTSASPSYAFVVTTTNVGTEKGELSIDTTVANTNDAGTDLDTYLDSTSADLDQALDSNFTLDGISGTITRSSNTINDLIAGVTLNLEKVNASAVTLNVQTDTATTESRVQEFVDKYNEVVAFLAENNTITREESGAEVENIFGPLAETRVDDNALQSLRNAIVGSTYELKDDPDDDAEEPKNTIRIFADLGITTQRDGTLSLNTDDFQSALADEVDSVMNILQNFGNATAKTQQIIDQFVGFNNIFDQTTRANQEQVSDLNDRIATAEEAIQREEDQTRARFARLESLISELQNQQQALTSALAGLGGGG